MNRWTLALNASLIIVAACASGGPGVEGPAAQALFNRWNGEWALDVDSSDDPAKALSEMGRGQGDGTRQGLSAGRGGGQRGGRGGGGRGGGGRGGTAASPRLVSRAGTDLVLALGQQRPQTLSLELTDSLFVVATTPGSRLSLPMDGEKLDVPSQAAEMEVKVSWQDQSPTIERTVDGVGGIYDQVELVANDRLLLTRRVTLGSESTSVRYVFDRVNPG